ncbi:MAG: acyl carrier protein [Pirellulales bacterium]|nr:acyl carrier protein [Pirellulales bacterium]
MEVSKSDIIQIIKDAGIVGDIDAIENDTLLWDGYLDSLDMANMLLIMEEKYSIKIPDEDVDKLESINAIAEYLSIQ